MAVVMAALIIGGGSWVAQQAAPAEAATRYVRPGVAGTCPNGIVAPFTDIQSAITAAGPGDFIFVCPGTYTEKLTIPAGKNGLTIQSVYWRQATIKVPAALTGNDNLIDINGSLNVTIKQFIIRGPTGCVSVIDETGLVPCNLWNGIAVWGNGTANILDNQFLTLWALMANGKLPYGQSYGNDIRFGFNGTPGRGTIDKNQLAGYLKTSIVITGNQSTATITNNLLQGAGANCSVAQNGIEVRFGATGTLRFNNIYDNFFYQPLGLIDCVAQDPCVGATALLAGCTTATGILLLGGTLFQGAGGPVSAATVGINQLLRNQTGVAGLDVINSTISNNNINGVKGTKAANTHVQGFGILMLDGVCTIIESSSVGPAGHCPGSAANNTIRFNMMVNNWNHDCHDETDGPYGAPPPDDVNNIWQNNSGISQNKLLLCVGGTKTGLPLPLGIASVGGTKKTFSPTK